MQAFHLALGLTFALIPVLIPAVAAAEPATRRSDLASPSGSARDLGTATLAQVAEPTAAPGEPPRFTDSVDVLQPPRPATPTYTVPRSEIQQRGAQNLADVLRGQPGFAINDYGPGADIHTGTYYRGNPINNTALLLNGRPYGNNVSTYHGNTDYNSIPTEIIEKVELSSGSAATLYGSHAFGGAINIVTRKGQGPPRLKAALEYGNLGQAAYRASYGGTSGPVDWLLAYQSTGTDNVYRVPVGAANRDPVSGLLANADTFFSSYYGNFSIELDERNTLAFDLTKSLSRRGLVYFGFPLQLDRLNHDGLNLGLTWTSRLGNGDDSKLNVALGYTQDYFSTYGPTRGVFSRTGNLNTELWTARVEHNWNVAPDHNLRYGLDVVQNGLGGEVVSSLPALVPLNSSGGQTIFNGALFALDTWSIAKNLQLELGFRQNVNSRFNSTFNPNAGLRWTISPAVSLRGSWVSVQRNPGPDQLFFFDTIHGWIANPNLIPETGSSWSAGLDVDFSPGLKGQFTYFGSTLNNRLSPQFIGFAQPGNVSLSQWQNIGTVATGGGEASLRWQIAPEWSTSLALTYTDSRIVSGPESGLQFALVPFTVGQLGIGYAHEGWQVNLFANYNSGSRRALFADGQAGFRTTDFSPAYFTLDLRLRAPITESLALTAFVQNLADTPYEKVNRIFLPGLAYRFGVETSF
jgi:vitamin B12 transporter